MQNVDLQNSKPAFANTWHFPDVFDSNFCQPNCNPKHLEGTVWAKAVLNLEDRLLSQFQIPCLTIKIGVNISKPEINWRLCHYGGLGCLLT